MIRRRVWTSTLDSRPSWAGCSTRAISRADMKRPVRTGRFMSARLIALVEHPAHEGRESKVEVQTRRRITQAGEEI